MTEQEFWARVYASSIAGHRSAEGRDLGGGELLWYKTEDLLREAASDADAALAEYRKRFALQTPVASKEFGSANRTTKTPRESTEHRLNIERAHLGDLETKLKSYEGGDRPSAPPAQLFVDIALSRRTIATLEQSLSEANRPPDDHEPATGFPF